MISEHVVARSTYLKGLPELTLIGVPEGLQSRPPMLGSYPRQFNADARFVWKKMLEDEAFKSQMKSADTPEDKWYMALKEFLARCEQLGVLPFNNITEEQKNDAVITSLQSARVELVTFANRIGLLEKLRITKACRDYKVKEKGFGIVSWAYCKYVDDPTFEQWLTKSPSPRFTRALDLKYSKMLQPNLLLWVRYPSPTRVTVGFEIQVASTVSIPGKRLATRKEIDSFVDRVIWKPIVRAHRFNGVGGRIF